MLYPKKSLINQDPFNLTKVKEEIKVEEKFIPLDFYIYRLESRELTLVSKTTLA